MYEEFYSLNANPFQLTPDERYFFASSAHQKALSYLEYGIAQGEGFVVITGEVGSGKSSLLSHFLPKVDRRRILVSKIVTTQIDPTDALRLALAGFGVVPKHPDKATILSAFNAFLMKQHKARRRVLLIVDEAQNLPRQTLEEFRMLSNLAQDGQPVFQCFLLAQPQFMSVIADPNMEQLRQRIIASFHLEAMTVTETRAYIEHRLRQAGWTGNPSFDPQCFDILHAASGGIPRRINTLAGRVLLLGALDQLTHITPEKVEEVVADLAEEVAGVAPPEDAGTADEATQTAAAAPADPALAEKLDKLIASSEASQAALARIADALEQIAAQSAEAADDNQDPLPLSPPRPSAVSGQ